MKLNQRRILNAIFSRADLSWGAYGILATIFLGSNHEDDINIQDLTECGTESQEQVQEYLNELKNEGWIG